MFDGLDASVQPIYVGASQIAPWVDRIRPHLERMASRSRGRYLAVDLITALAAGRMQLWVALEGPVMLCMLITEIMDYPRCRAMRLIGLVGTRPYRWRGLLSAIEVSARENFGCRIMEAHAPRRFGVILPGYEATHDMFEKAL